MTSQLRVMSIYEGFFSGGARALHTTVVAGLHTGGSHQHSVLSIYGAMRRETILQRMEDDASYRSLHAIGVEVRALGRRIGGDTAARKTFTAAEVANAFAHAERADIVLSLKEQPLRLVNLPGFPRKPVIVCLHRSDPENQGSALAEFKTAVADGRVAAAICCAESTRAAYQKAGIPGGLLKVVPNGVDLTRFQPVTGRKRAALRRSLGVPAKAEVVTLAARYDAMKNIPLFLAAGRRYLEREPNGHVLMCGAGMTTANVELCGLLNDLFDDEPRFLGRLHLLGIRRDMEAVYAATDVVALTSTSGEAAPLCLIEGAMCGAVPVSTDIGDTARIVDGIGLITAPEPDAIAAAWSEAVDRRAQFTPRLLGSRERFSHTRMIASYATVINRAHRDLGLRVPQHL
ncbi:glycosyltransferase [Dactylosporangium sp. NPDC051541]|uniref:glycosyltransferase n=1 Tax=Dactylosporangium sp. NPDC051541 TaxID=3363977 RepID=UPI00378E5295